MSKYLSRGTLYQKQAPTKDAKKIYIFCEGETEVKYFNYFKEISSNLDVIPIGNENGKSDPLKLKAQAEKLFFGDVCEFVLSKEYKDEVWFVIDTDEWELHGKIQPLKGFCTEKSDNTGNVFCVAQNNPCFEVWQYYHFYNQKPEKIEVENHISFKDFLNNTFRGGFDSKKHAINLEIAISNAKNNFMLNPENNQPSLYGTEVYLLGEVILPFVKEKLDQASEKNGKINQGNI